MRKHFALSLLTFLALLLATPCWSQSYPALDSFSGSGALSANWSAVANNGSIVQASGKAVPSVSGGAGMAAYTGVSFNANQYSQFVFVTSGTSGNNTGPCVRMTTSGNGYCYLADIGEIYWLTNGSGSGNLTSSCPIPANGDTIQLSVTGTTLTCKDVTTSTSASVINTTYANGDPAMLIDQTHSTATALKSFQADCIPTCSLGTVATPTFSPAAGGYHSSQSVTISDTTTGAVIHYTTDGSTPTGSSATYSTPISVTKTETVKAIGIKSGYTNSAVGSALYTLTVATPTFSPAAGGYSSSQTVTISSTSTGAVIHYTTDGTTPTASSATYSSAITVSKTETVKALGIITGWTNSAVGSATYTLTVTTPTFSPVGGSYGSAQSVTISDATAGAVIHYTTDGTTPTSGSATYSTPINVAITETVKAIGVVTGWTNSAVGSAAYTISSTYPVLDPFSGSGALSANWSTVANNGSIVQASGKAVPSVSGSAGMATYTGVSFSNDQYSQFVFQTSGTSGNNTGPCVRMTTSGNGYCYLADIGEIYWLTNGVGSGNLTPACPIPANGDTIQLSVTGTTLTCKDVTTSTSASVTNSTYTTGDPAMLIDQTHSTVTALASFQADCIPTCATGGGGTVATPTFSPVAGSYSSAQSVTISDSTSGATLHYTTDGSTPTATSTTYTTPITVSVSETVKAIGVESGWTNSLVGSAAYTIGLTVATPTFSPVAGSYSSAQTVTISDSTSGATLHYTTDGSTPTATSTTYTTPITVSVSETVKAIGVLSGYTNSLVGSATYTIGGGTTHSWFIRTDGGSRYSTDNTSGQCNGMYDASYASTGGTGTNQNCAFNDVRYLWDDGAYGNDAWVISGGDTVVVRGCSAAPDQQNPNNPTCRIGWDTNSGSGSLGWCAGSQANTGCFNPTIPAGTPTQHTRILGGCAYDGTCHSGNNTIYANLTQLHGGFGAGTTLNAGSTQYVDIAGFEITDQAQCDKSVGISNGCATFPPAADDYASTGLQFDNNMANVTFTDMNIHGLASTGVYGPIGGDITMTRVRISGNASSGWNLDNGTASTGGTAHLLYTLIEWSGCVEEYPIIDNPAPYICFDQSSGGYGDAIGTPGNDAASFDIENSTFRYNTQDGPDLAHSTNGVFVIENSQSYGNEGQSIKLGATSNSTVQNSIIVNNCNVLAAGNTFPGARSGFNVNLNNTCRAGGDVFNMNWGGASQVFHFDFNTVIAGGAVLLDIHCNNPVSCASGTKTLRNNVFVGYAVTGYNGDQAPGVFCYSSCNNDSPPYSDDTQWTDRSHNYFYQFRDCPSPLWVGETCANPQLAAQLTSPTTNTLFQYSAFDFYPASGAPIIDTGVAIPGITTDYYGTTRPNPPTIGAVE